MAGKSHERISNILRENNERIEEIIRKRSDDKTRKSEGRVDQILLEQLTRQQRKLRDELIVNPDDGKSVQE